MFMNLALNSPSVNGLRGIALRVQDLGGELRPSFVRTVTSPGIVPSPAWKSSVVLVDDRLGDQLLHHRVGDGLLGELVDADLAADGSDGQRERQAGLRAHHGGHRALGQERLHLLPRGVDLDDVGVVRDRCRASTSSSASTGAWSVVFIGYGFTQRPEMRPRLAETVEQRRRRGDHPCTSSANPWTPSSPSSVASERLARRAGPQSRHAPRPCRRSGSAARPLPRDPGTCHR